MTLNSLQIREPSFYHRDSGNDLPSSFQKSKELVLRVSSAILPILSLYRPFGKIFVGVSTGFRTTKNASEAINSFCEKKYLDLSKDLFNVSLSIASVAGAIFANPLGLLISTAQDIGHNSYETYKLLSNDKYSNLEVIKKVMNTATSSLYLVAMFYGCLEVQVAALAILIATELISSLNEYKKADYIQLASHLIMSVARTCQLIPKVNHLKAKWAFEKEMKAYFSHLDRIYVGDLNEKWQFPSDHLPVASNVDGTQIISWNVLNNKYMDWVYNDSQGLNGSMLTDLDVPLDGKAGLTKRDELVINMIKYMTGSKNGIISLQECGLVFLDNLEKVLPQNWEIVRSSNKNLNDQNVILFNKNTLTYKSDQSTISFDGYPCNIGRSIMNCLFERSDGTNMRIFNSHLPGNPALPGRFEFCEYIKNNTNEDEISVAMGDMNFENHEMKDACNKQGLTDAVVVSPDYGTNVDRARESKTIDHFIISGTKKVYNIAADKILPGLEKIAALLPVYK